MATFTIIALKFVIAFIITTIVIVLFLTSYLWLKYKINYDPEKELLAPLMQPRIETGLQRTLLLVRGADIEAGLTGKVISKFEKAGFNLVSMKLVASGSTAFEKHFAALKGKGYFEELVGFCRESPVTVMVWEGIDVVERAKKILGYVNPAMLGGSFCIIKGGRNIALPSQDFREAVRELALWFSDREVKSWVHSKASVFVGPDDYDQSDEKLMAFGEGVFDDISGKFTLTREDFQQFNEATQEWDKKDVLTCIYIKGTPHVHPDYENGQFTCDSFQRQDPSQQIGEVKLNNIIKEIFESADKDIETDAVSKDELESWLVKLQQTQMEEHNMFAFWDQKQFDKIYNLFEEDEEDGADKPPSPEDGLDKGELSKLIKRIACL